MPNLKITGQYKRATIGGVYELGDGANSAIVTSHRVYVRHSQSPDTALNGGAITVMSRAKGDQIVTLAQDAGVAVSYVKRFLNGSVADDSLTNTTITSESLIIIPSSGQVPILSIAAIVAGFWDIYVEAVEGTA